MRIIGFSISSFYKYKKADDGNFPSSAFTLRMRLVADLSAAGRGLDQRVGEVLSGGHDQRRVTAAGIGAHTAVRAGNRNSGDHLAGRVANRRGNRTHALIAFID